jgi:8-oxo-dGTP diphosphatase
MIRVAAGIIERNDMILIAQRHRKDTNGLKWEFPGGTLKRDECGEDGIVRELFEELNINVEVVGFYSHYTEPPFKVEYYFVKYISGDIKLVEHEQVKWVTKDRLQEFDLLSGDRIIAEKLRSI